jgi:hypothetical protein
MAKWTVANKSFTPVAVGDTASFTDNGYLAVQGAASTQRIKFVEIYMGGQATAQAPMIMEFARDSTIAASSITAGTNGRGPVALVPNASTLSSPPLAVGASTTKPQRSSTLSLLELSFNAFGGVVRMVFAEGDEPEMLGNTQPFGETSLSAFTGGTPGAMAAHIIIEPI